MTTQSPRPQGSSRDLAAQVQLEQLEALRAPAGGAAVGCGSGGLRWLMR